MTQNIEKPCGPMGPNVFEMIFYIFYIIFFLIGYEWAIGFKSTDHMIYSGVIITTGIVFILVLSIYKDNKWLFPWIIGCKENLNPWAEN